MEDKSSLTIIAIVAIVAIVGLVVMLRGQSNNMMQPASFNKMMATGEAGNAAGMATNWYGDSITCDNHGDWAFLEDENGNWKYISKRAGASEANLALFASKCGE